MSLSGYILSIDQGTTSSRALILNELGQILAQKNIEFKQYYPKNGWVEHDPVEILKTTTDAIKQVLAELKINAQDVVVAGITNQRETIVAWDKLTGKPIYNAIVWQDRRTENYCNELKEKNLKILMLAEIDEYFILDLVDPPFLPTEKSKPYRALITVFGTFFGFLIGLFILGLFRLMRYEVIFSLAPFKFKRNKLLT